MGLTSSKSLFNDLSFHLRQGEVLGLSGPSDCGKSSLSLPHSHCSSNWMICVICISWSAARSKISEYCQRLKIRRYILTRYPYQVSGGELQRVAMMILMVIVIGSLRLHNHHV
jgi:ABC-type dipeptide/oligopeptide/nickel transport system ATPase subunit